METNIHIQLTARTLTSTDVNHAKASCRKPPAPSSDYHMPCQHFNVHELEILEATDSAGFPEPTALLEDRVATCRSKD